jgi:hypothetical protein
VERNLASNSSADGAFLSAFLSLTELVASLEQLAVKTTSNSSQGSLQEQARQYLLENVASISAEVLQPEITVTTRRLPLDQKSQHCAN